MTLLGLAQQRARIRKELTRRIGYTNGLHDIFRFARVTGYLHPITPASRVSLRTVISDQENVRGAKYANGVIEVAGALGLIDKVGTKLTLSDKGYALHAVHQLDTSTTLTEALLLHLVLESDGDATLNLLELIATGTSTDSLGPKLVERLLKAIELRERWATIHLSSKFVRDIVLQELSDSQNRLHAAVDLGRKRPDNWASYRQERRLNAHQKVERFYSHTIMPRRGWLKDLGCLRPLTRTEWTVTERGNRLLAYLKGTSSFVESVLMLPFSHETLEHLGVAQHSDHATDLLWIATASSFADQTSSAKLSTSQFFDLITTIYPRVRLPLFNEATIESIYNVMSAKLAVAGTYFSRQAFDEQLNEVTSEYSDRIYRLRQRRGAAGYIALRNLSL